MVGSSGDDRWSSLFPRKTQPFLWDVHRHPHQTKRKCLHWRCFSSIYKSAWSASLFDHTKSWMTHFKRKICFERCEAPCFLFPPPFRDSRHVVRQSHGAMLLHCDERSLCICDVHAALTTFQCRCTNLLIKFANISSEKRARNIPELASSVGKLIKRLGVVRWHVGQLWRKSDIALSQERGKARQRAAQVQFVDRETQRLDDWLRTKI